MGREQRGIGNFVLERRLNQLKTSDFNFELPQELIAQTPLEQRDASRLMTLNKATG